MNQILLTKKLYLTPELKRKQALYKMFFFLCVFGIGILFSIYLYGLYEQNFNENISQEIFSSVSLNSSLSKNDSVLVVYLDNDVNDDELIELDLDDEPAPLLSTYTASNGKEYDIVGLIRIPSIDIGYPILAKTTDSLLKISVCKYDGPDPNEVGNLCIAGHNFTNTRAFSKLHKVEIGDIVEITDLSGKMVKYVVYDHFIVYPTDLSCTSQRTNGKKEITLFTCTNGVKQRRIVKAVELVEGQDVDEIIEAAKRNYTNS